MLGFAGRAGAGETALNTGIRAVAVQDTAGGPVIWAVTGPGGGITAWRVGVTGGAERIDSVHFASGGGLGAAMAESVAAGGARVAVTGSSGGVTTYTLSADGGIGGRGALSLARPSETPSHLVQSANGAVFSAYRGSDLIDGYLPAGGGLSHHGQQRLAGGPVAALAVARAGGTDFLIAAGADDGTLASYRVDAGAGLARRALVGSEQGLAMAPAVTGLETVSAHGVTYVLAASASVTGGALSVLRLGGDGGLTLTDHVLDTRETRFGAVQSLSVLARGDEVLVLAGGGDDGVSLFSLLPGGLLVHRDTLEHATGQALENVSDLALFAEGDRVGAVVAGQAAPGLSLLSVAVGAPGLVREARAAGGTLNGGAGDDQLVGHDGADTLRGGAGADILVDGGGSDRLEGGTGRDVFVLVRDGVRDTIRGFEPQLDRIDLSLVPMLYDPDAVQLTATSFGARMRFGDDVTDIHSAAGGALNLAWLRDAIEIAVNRPAILPRTAPVPEQEPPPPILTPPPPRWDVPDPDPERVPDPDPIPDTDPDDPDNPVARPPGTDPDPGPDPDPQPVPDLTPLPGRTLTGGARSDRLIGGARDDVLSGGGGGDLLDGGERQDTLKGGGGADTLSGGDGWDLLKGGAGGDVMDGGDGNDLLKGGGGPDGLFGGPGDDTLKGGRDDDRLAGDNGDDLLKGGKGDDTLDGLDGHDTLKGGKGRDILRGGSGDDVAKGGGDDDRLIGRDGDDRLVGGAGNDRLEGETGDDWLKGGRGADSFVFRPAEGRDVIADFRPGSDQLVLDMAERPLRRLIDHADADGLWLDLDGGSVLLDGLAARDLEAGDVLFV